MLGLCDVALQYVGIDVDDQLALSHRLTGLHPNAAHFATGAAIDQGVLIGLHAAVRFGVVGERTHCQCIGGHHRQGALQLRIMLGQPGLLLGDRSIQFLANRLQAIAHGTVLGHIGIGDRATAGCEQQSGGKNVKWVPHGYGVDQNRSSVLRSSVRAFTRSATRWI